MALPGVGEAPSSPAPPAPGDAGEAREPSGERVVTDGDAPVPIAGEAASRRERWGRSELIVVVAVALVVAGAAWWGRGLAVGGGVPRAATRTPDLPGGRWGAPAAAAVVSGNTLRFAARAYPAEPGNPSVAAVYFTAAWSGPEGGWHVACKVEAATPNTPDTYECEWTIPEGVGNGPLTISFDVYDRSGNVRKAPNGLRQVEVRRSAGALSYTRRDRTGDERGGER